jgi:hypothetical protein
MNHGKGSSKRKESKKKRQMHECVSHITWIPLNVKYIKMAVFSKIEKIKMHQFVLHFS